MSSVLFDSVGRNQAQPAQPQNELVDFLQNVQQFKNQFQGVDPRTKVAEAVRNGIISQPQVNQYLNMVGKIGGFIK